ncbi:hypothetical protein RF11_14942 [Thelohanellus kitauei]|uniref:Uncharacterized protein n=1 Tax=Thelohanellus kitauei TaxID=669202 RepID=A0A0C2NA42_THEKT|nr:hypothetical protein RF11_14942 [Thelohanellus kitauei]
MNLFLLCFCCLLFESFSDSVPTGCVDIYSANQTGGLSGNVSNKNIVNSRYDCCLPDSNVCLRFDPCLTFTADEKDIYRAFLSGPGVHPYTLVPFHSRKSYIPDYKDYALEFYTDSNNKGYILINVIKLGSPNQTIISGYFKARQSKNCDFFSRYGKRETRNFVIQLILSIVIGMVAFLVCIHIEWTSGRSFYQPTMKKGTNPNDDQKFNFFCFI